VNPQFTNRMNIGTNGVVVEHGQWHPQNRKLEYRVDELAETPPLDGPQYTLRIWGDCPQLALICPAKEYNLQITADRISFGGHILEFSDDIEVVKVDGVDHRLGGPSAGSFVFADGRLVSFDS
jgi:hypothetical protein